MANKLSIEQLLKIMSMSKIGRKTTLKFIQEQTFNISNDNDLVDFISENASKFRLPQYSKLDFEIAFNKAEQILINSEKLGIKLISFQDENYPKLLSEITDFPIILNYIGDITILSTKPSVAIIGTRDATDFGFKMGVRLGEYFAAEGFNVVSGLAIGCDTAGHVGALNAKGLTTAVLAHGLDKVYPKENKDLALRIVENGGLLLSEYFAKQSALSNFFVERDRIQAGLSLGVIVIQTDVKGGTMHTVKFCLENKRILATVNFPHGHLHEPKTQGNQLLIREGKAIPIFNKDEVDSLVINLRNSFKIHSEFSDIKPKSSNKKQSKPKPKKNTETDIQTKLL